MKGSRCSVKIGGWFMERQLRYEKFIKTIHDHIIGAFQTKSKLMTSRGMKEEDGEK